jgi:hypothetical protein
LGDAGSRPAALAASRRCRARCFPAPPRYHKVFIARELVVRTAKRPAPGHAAERAVLAAMTEAQAQMIAAAHG